MSLSTPSLAAILILVLLPSENVQESKSPFFQADVNETSAKRKSKEKCVNCGVLYLSRKAGNHPTSVTFGLPTDSADLEDKGRDTH